MYQHNLSPRTARLIDAVCKYFIHDRHHLGSNMRVFCESRVQNCFPFNQNWNWWVRHGGDIWTKQRRTRDIFKLIWTDCLYSHPVHCTACGCVCTYSAFRKYSNPSTFSYLVRFQPYAEIHSAPPSIYTQYLIATKRKQNSRNVYKFIKRGKKEISLSFDWNLAQVIFEMFLHLDYCPPEVNLNDWTGF